MSRQLQTRLDQHQTKDLIKGYPAGASAKELADRYGIHRTTVTAILQRDAIKPRHHGW
jgi:DNA invertase Pin-like site-specific DNA recombinase